MENITTQIIDKTSELVVGLDLGTTKIAAIVGRKTNLEK